MRQLKNKKILAVIFVVFVDISIAETRNKIEHSGIFVFTIERVDITLALCQATFMVE